MGTMVKIYGNLRRYTGGRGTISLDLDAGAIVRDVIKRLRIPEEEVKNIMVNGRRRTIYHELGRDDRVAVFPLVAGG